MSTEVTVALIIVIGIIALVAFYIYMNSLSVNTNPVNTIIQIKEVEVIKHVKTEARYPQRRNATTARSLPSFKTKTTGKQKHNGGVLAKCRSVYSDVYNYEDAIVNGKIIYNIMCSKHGTFKQTTAKHLAGWGCKKCMTEIYGHCDVDRFKAESGWLRLQAPSVKKAIKMRAPTIVKEVKMHTPVKEVASTVDTRIYRSKGERLVADTLTSMGISFKKEHSFSGCRDVAPLRFDFYIPSKSICIEFDGVQHRSPVEIFGGTHEYMKRIARDRIKSTYCAENNISLIRVCDNDISGIKSRINQMADVQLAKFSQDASMVHYGRYEYIKLKGSTATVRCSKHGNFSVSKSKHLSGTGCGGCGQLQGNTSSIMSRKLKKMGIPYERTDVDGTVGKRGMYVFNNQKLIMYIIPKPPILRRLNDVCRKRGYRLHCVMWNDIIDEDYINSMLSKGRK